jgi:predicted dehydrogenase
MSRRTFIKQSSLLLGGVLLNNDLIQATNFNPTEKIRLGVIGTGSRGRGCMGLIKKLPGLFTITALCDIMDFQLKPAVEMFPNAKTYKDYHQLLDDKNVQAVFIATPLFLHYPMASDALKAGKHVYLEKPMTYSIEQAIALEKEAKEHSDQVLQIGYQLPYSPVYKKVIEMIEKGYLGKVTQIHCRFDRNASWRLPLPDPSLEKIINWRMYREFCGGITTELLSHQMDFINRAFNTHPDEIFSTGGIDFYKDGRTTFDNVEVMMRYNNANMVGNYGATCANEREGFIFKIKGSRGTVEMLLNEGLYFPEEQTKKELETVDGVAGATKIEYNVRGGIPLIKGKAPDSTGLAFTDFYNCIIEKRLPPSNVFIGKRAAICAHLANMALDSHSTQYWKPEYNS